MEVNELRIGNYLSDGKEVFKVEKAFFTLLELNMQFCKPIPLTEEWLLRFGFVESQDIDTVFGLKLNDFWYINEFQIRNKFNAILLDVELKYVHQLQNLYFALTNKELTLK
jgi:hypothetical protein